MLLKKDLYKIKKKEKSYEMIMEEGTTDVCTDSKGIFETVEF